MRAVLFVSHGSYSSKPKEEALELAKVLQQRSKVEILEVAFLEIEIPDIAQGLKICIDKGAGEILVLLNFLNSGRHVSKDIPSIVKEVQQQYPNVNITISSPIGQHPKIADLFVDLIDHSVVPIK